MNRIYFFIEKCFATKLCKNGARTQCLHYQSISNGFLIFLSSSVFRQFVRCFSTDNLCYLLTKNFQEITQNARTERPRNREKEFPSITLESSLFSKFSLLDSGMLFPYEERRKMYITQFAFKYRRWPWRQYLKPIYLLVCQKYYFFWHTH